MLDAAGIGLKAPAFIQTSEIDPSGAWWKWCHFVCRDICLPNLTLDPGRTIQQSSVRSAECRQEFDQSHQCWYLSSTSLLENLVHYLVSVSVGDTNTFEEHLPDTVRNYVRLYDSSLSNYYYTMIGKWLITPGWRLQCVGCDFPDVHRSRSGVS